MALKMRTHDELIVFGELLCYPAFLEMALVDLDFDEIVAEFAVRDHHRKSRKAVFFRGKEMQIPPVPLSAIKDGRFHKTRFDLFPFKILDYSVEALRPDIGDIPCVVITCVTIKVDIQCPCMHLHRHPRDCSHDSPRVVMPAKVDSRLGNILYPLKLMRIDPSQHKAAKFKIRTVESHEFLVIHPWIK
jgi:hypothetical protein